MYAWEQMHEGNSMNETVYSTSCQPLVFALLDGPEAAVVWGPSVTLAGQQVTFKCSSSSEPPSQYSWYFNGSLVANGSQYITENVTTAMSGKFICMAFNNITGHNTTAYTMLTVYGNYSC